MILGSLIRRYINSFHRLIAHEEIIVLGDSHARIFTSKFWKIHCPKVYFHV
jgi:hypothetical protein